MLKAWFIMICPLHVIKWITESYFKYLQLLIMHHYDRKNTSQQIDAPGPAGIQFKMI